MLVKKDVTFCFKNENEDFYRGTHVYLSDISRFHCAAFSFDFTGSEFDDEPAQIICLAFEHYCMLVNENTSDSCLIDFRSPDHDEVVDFFSDCYDFKNVKALDAFATEFISMLPVLSGKCPNSRISLC